MSKDKTNSSYVTGWMHHPSDLTHTFCPQVATCRLRRNSDCSAQDHLTIKRQMISEHVTEWLGYPVKVFDAEETKGDIDCANTLYRLALSYDDEDDFPTLFSKFLSGPNAAQTPAIIIGQFFGDNPSQGAEDVVQLLVAAQSKLPNLKGIFLADVIGEESEISWINQTDISPILLAYPSLEHLRLRGTNELSLGGRMSHAKLKSLTIETGGLPPRVFEEVMAGQLPALEMLELWLGTPSYGGDVTVENLNPLLTGQLFPRLKHLGLRDSQIVDQIAEALKAAPILQRLEALDLSLGTLSDEGAQHLVENPALKALKKLDLHYHFLSKEMIAAVKQALPLANLDDSQESTRDPEDRYVAVSE
jgi:hypothetical protein